MSKVLAKFRVTKTAQIEAWNNGPVPGHEITLHPVKGEPFGPATPSGQITMLILNPAAAEHFHVGKEYFVTFKEDTGEGAD